MVEQKYLVVRMETQLEEVPYLTPDDVASRCGVHPELIDRFVRWGLIDTVMVKSDGVPLFDWEVVPLVRKIMRLHQDLGVNFAGVGVVLELLSRIETLEAQIREMERRVFGG